jgi:hypothetical protein
MKVLLVSEGKHELGQGDGSGSLATLSRRLMNCEVEFICKKVSDEKVRTHLIHGKFPNFERRALGWIEYAKSERFDAIILVIDQDGYPERQKGIDAAHADPRISFPRALGIAIFAFDAWMLADETAWLKACQKTLLRQKKPESIRAPKRHCERLCHDLGIELGLSDHYAAIAEHADLDQIAHRCPKGFKPFKERVEGLAKRI